MLILNFIRPIICAALVLATLSACGSMKPPREKLDLANDLFNQAENAQAHRFAPEEFKAAEQHLKNARQALNDNDYLQAERLADRSAMDSKAAIVKSGLIKARAAVDQLKQSRKTPPELNAPSHSSAANH